MYRSSVVLGATARSAQPATSTHRQLHAWSFPNITKYIYVYIIIALQTHLYFGCGSSGLFLGFCFVFTGFFSPVSELGSPHPAARGAVQCQRRPPSAPPAPRRAHRHQTPRCDAQVGATTGLGCRRWHNPTHPHPAKVGTGGGKDRQRAARGSGTRQTSELTHQDGHKQNFGAVSGKAIPPVLPRSHHQAETPGVSGGKPLTEPVRCFSRSQKEQARLGTDRPHPSRLRGRELVAAP